MHMIRLFIVSFMCFISALVLMELSIVSPTRRAKSYYKRFNKSDPFQRVYIEPSDGKEVNSVELTPNAVSEEQMLIRRDRIVNSMKEESVSVDVNDTPESREDFVDQEVKKKRLWKRISNFKDPGEKKEVRSKRKRVTVKEHDKVVEESAGKSVPREEYKLTGRFHHSGAYNPGESEKAPYYPRDHLSDGHLYRLRMTINAKEAAVLNRVVASVPELQRRYSEMFHFFRRSYKLWNLLSEQEREQLNALNGVQREQMERSLMGEVKRRDKEVERQVIEEGEERFRSWVHWEAEAPACDGCVWAGRSTHLKKMMTPYLRKFEGNREVFDISTMTHYILPPADPYDVTAIFVTTIRRMQLLPQILFRWPGEVLIVLNGEAREEGTILEYINNHFLPARVTIIVSLLNADSPEAGSFPVNRLRNLAIRNVRTSHFQVMDMDLWPSRNLYAELMRLPKEVVFAENTAVILPILFFDKSSFLRRCNSISRCSTLALRYMPENKTEVAACVQSHMCMTSKNLIRTHMYIMPEWFTTDPAQALLKIRCFFTDFQEPYFLLRYDSHTILFDERFHDYGYNKVQLYEHLRAASYSFYILNNAFAMDLPHPDSVFRSSYLHSLKADRNPMKEVYRVFQEELNKNYSQVRRFPVCASVRYTYYTAVS